MSLTAAPNTPIRTPQPRSSAKSLQLTPIWQEVVKNGRLPQDLDQDLLFKEISVRLEDFEWPVRQHAFRVLNDIIPIIPRDRLDEGVARYDILGKVVVNLGHPAPGIRKVASETVQKYLKRTSQTAKQLEDFLQIGLKEKDVGRNEQTGIMRENVTLGTIATMSEVLKPFILPENGGHCLSQSFLAEVIQALNEKSKSGIYRENCQEALWKIKEMVGEARFYLAIGNLPEREHIMNLLNLNDDSRWSDENSFGVPEGQDSFDVAPSEGEGRDGQDEGPAKEGSSEDFSDGTDTETYTKEPAPNLDDDAVYYHVNRAEISHYTPPSFVPIEHSDNYLPVIEAKDGEGDKPSRASSPRVVLEAEIQVSKNKAITMKVVEDENESQNNDRSDPQRRFTTENGDLVMKVLHDAEEVDEEEKTRTPRRVRFGGEVIKLRTPDSDTTDITIEIHEAGDSPATITTTTTTTNSAKQEDKPESKSLIPVALAPGRIPSREPSPSRRTEPSRIPVPKDGTCPPPKNESPESVVSSSGSEGDVGDRCPEECPEGEDEAWRWADLRLVEENILKDLKCQDNWKIQYQALEQLKLVLINPKTIERIGKIKNHEKLNSLFNCLLHRLPQENNQQVTTLSLSIVTQLVETLPKELILLDVEDIVRGLCRYVGGCKNLNLKIEAVQSLKMLFGILEPSAVMDVLVGEGCLLSSCSKLRENSLLAIMYATMTFPSDVFDAEKILEKVVCSVGDPRRRVRHAALEAVAVLSQFCSSQSLADGVARVAEGLPTPSARAQLVAAVQARLSRRLLPTISGEGLVLYALQIPASRRFGHLGNPMGADVDWILSGTGSVSTGSARSKSQLNAAQRLEPPVPLSPSKWAQSERAPKPLPGDNPWKIQKHRTESSAPKNGGPAGRNRFYKTNSTGSLHEGHVNKVFEANFPNMAADHESRLRPEEITWALVPISALDEPLLGRERSNSLWGESFGEITPQYLPSALGPLRPMYLKLQPAHDQFILSRSTDDVRKTSYGGKKDLEDFSEIRLLTPTIQREKTYSENPYQNGKHPRNDGRGATRIPVLCTDNKKSFHRPPRSTQQYGNDRKISDSDDALQGTQKPARPSNGFNGSPAFLPSIHGGHETTYSLQKSPAKFGDVDEMKLQDTMTQLSGLLTGPKAIVKPGTRELFSVKNELDADVNGNDSDQIGEADVFDDKIQGKLFDRGYLKNRETLPNAVASAPPVISTDSRDQIPSTSSSNSTDFGTLSGSELRLRRLTNGSSAVDSGGGLPYRKYATYNPKLKGKKSSQTRTSNKVGINGNSFPDSLKPFERPKEGLDTCFSQLESQQWEVNMLGLTSLVRLLRHHPAMVLSQLHPIIVALGRQIRNLRSQVARVACQASAELFVALKRNVELDLEELSGPLFHRAADTNRFIRADCNHALDNMVDNVGHAKAVNVIISKGTTHQNATVRAVAARLLLRLSEKAGAEKLLSIPKEIRDRMLQAGANLLMEGKLETSLILEAVQPNVMRHISKTLLSLKS